MNEEDFAKEMAMVILRNGWFSLKCKEGTDQKSAEFAEGLIKWYMKQPGVLNDLPTNSQD